MADKPSTPPFFNTDTAPFIYFDTVAANGVLAGAIQVELCARMLTPEADGNVLAEFMPTARLRCSPQAAQHLIAGLQAALKVFEQSQGQGPMAAPGS
jgi:hypothetical protein